MTGTSRQPIELVVLDMAGTTVADEGTVEAAFAEAMRSVGVAPGTERFDAALEHVRSTMGSSKIEVFRHVCGGDEEQAGAANAAFESAYDEAVRRDGAAEVPGAESAIAELRRRGLRVCLTTGFSPSTRDLLLDALGWRHLVDLALSPADAGRGRPWPDLVLTAVLRLEVSAVAAVAVAGDTASDLWAGTRAGAAVVAGVLTGAHDRPTLEAAPHTHILPSVVELADVIAEAG